MVDYNRLLSTLEENNSFILSDGSKIRSLSSLLDALKTMADNVFISHVNSDKNDFAEWIEHCFSDELLSQRISKLKTKEEIISELKTRIEQAKIALSIKNTVPFNQAPRIEKKASLQDTEDKSKEDDLTLDDDLDIKDAESTNISQVNQNGQKPVLDDILELDSDLGLDKVNEKAADKPAENIVEPELDNALDLDNSLDAAPDINTKSAPDISLKPELKTDTQEINKKEQTIEKIINQGNIEKKEDLVQIKASLEPVLTGVEIKKEETPKEEKKPITVSNEEKVTKQEPEAISQSAIVLSDDEERILKTDNKDLSAADLFKKFKLQKHLSITSSKDETAKKQVLSESEIKAEDKEILNTDDKKLSFKDLFRKLKLKKDLNIGQEEIKKEEQKDEKPVDLLNISEEEFNKLIGVNINDGFNATTSKDHIIKRKEQKFLKTGVPGFDELVEKGIPSGSAVLVSGGPGSGKTTFCIQQLGYAAEHGEKCLFISLEEQEERLIEHMKGYGLNPEKYLKNGNLRIKKLDSFKLSRAVEALLAHARGELLIDVAPVLDIIPEGYSPDRVVVDSLSSIAAAFAGKPEEYRIYVEQLFNIFGSIGVTSFIITEIQGSEATGHGGAEDFLADGVVNFYNMKHGASRLSAMEILKMRGVGHRKKIVPFNFISGKGIEIYPLEDVFHES